MYLISKKSRPGFPQVTIKKDVYRECFSSQMSFVNCFAIHRINFVEQSRWVRFSAVIDLCVPIGSS